nr:MAG TPA: hypothetical protein [Caudoviricetes sp.]
MMLLNKVLYAHNISTMQIFCITWPRRDTRPFTL